MYYFQRSPEGNLCCLVYTTVLSGPRRWGDLKRFVSWKLVKWISCVWCVIVVEHTYYYSVQYFCGFVFRPASGWTCTQCVWCVIVVQHTYHYIVHCFVFFQTSLGMNVYTVCLVCCLVACLLGQALVTAASADTVDKRPSKEQLVLYRLVSSIQNLAQEADDLQAFIEKAAGELDLGELAKRQAWEMDYGWGGGRFGKRSDGKKRYDAYGMAGRFGRDTAHVKSDNQH